jgi:hypothetical protein
LVLNIMPNSDSTIEAEVQEGILFTVNRSLRAGKEGCNIAKSDGRVIGLHP